jgi:serine/threonine protein kinase
MINVINPQQVAIKILSPGNKCDLEDIDREIAILKLLKHPNIIHLLDVIHDEPSKKIFLVFELVNGGDLFDYTIARGRLSEREARRIMREVVGGVAYCHAHMVVHRDLKLENLLMDKDGHCRIAGMVTSHPITTYNTLSIAPYFTLSDYFTVLTSHRFSCSLYAIRLRNEWYHATGTEDAHILRVTHVYVTRNCARLGVWTRSGYLEFRYDINRTHIKIKEEKIQTGDLIIIKILSCNKNTPKKSNRVSKTVQIRNGFFLTAILRRSCVVHYLGWPNAMEAFKYQECYGGRRGGHACWAIFFPQQRETLSW